MIFFKTLSKFTVKFAKGIFISYSILIAAVLIVQSCKKTEVVKNDHAAERFLSEMSKAGKALQTIAVKNVTSSTQQSFNRRNQQSTNPNGPVLMTDYGENQEVGFINFDDMPINPDYSYNLNGMAGLVTNYNGTFSYEPSSNSVEFQVPLPDVTNALTPLIAEARVYLNARGLTNTDIDQMIVEEQGQESDLVPYAAALAKCEQSANGLANVNYMNLFFNSASATPSVLHCVGVALGVDGIWALMQSGASGWTKAGMKKAFKAVAKRALGFIGAAIAVVSFGLCMGDLLP